MNERPTVAEIEAVLVRAITIRERWQGNPGYARTLDIEVRALRLLLTMTKIAEDAGEDETNMGVDA